MEQQLRTIFEECNKDPNGYIEEGELGTILQNLGLNPTPEKVRILMLQLDQNGDGKIDFNEFYKGVSGLYSQGIESQEELPSFTEEQMVHIRRVFRGIDSSGSGKIDIDELTDALKQLGIPCSSEEVFQLMEKIDQDHDGSITFSEFVNGIESWMMQSLSQNSAYPGLSAEQILEIQVIFNQVDRTGSGLLNGEGIEQILQELGTTLAQEELASLMAALDLDKDGMISLHEFLSGISRLQGHNFSAPVKISRTPSPDHFSDSPQRNEIQKRQLFEMSALNDALKSRCEELEDENKSLLTEIEQMKRKNASNQKSIKELNQLKQSTQQLYGEITESNDKLNEHNQAISRLKKENEKLKQDNQKFKQSTDDMFTKYSKALEQKEMHEAELKNLKQNLERTRVSEVELKTRVEDSEKRVKILSVQEQKRNQEIGLLHQQLEQERIVSASSRSPSSRSSSPSLTRSYSRGLTNSKHLSLLEELNESNGNEDDNEDIPENVKQLENERLRLLDELDEQKSIQSDLQAQLNRTRKDKESLAIQLLQWQAQAKLRGDPSYRDDLLDEQSLTNELAQLRVEHQEANKKLKELEENNLRLKQELQDLLRFHDEKSIANEDTQRQLMQQLDQLKQEKTELIEQFEGDKKLMEEMHKLENNSKKQSFTEMNFQFHQQAQHKFNQEKKQLEQEKQNGLNELQSTLEKSEKNNKNLKKHVALLEEKFKDLNKIQNDRLALASTEVNPASNGQDLRSQLERALTELEQKSSLLVEMQFELDKQMEENKQVQSTSRRRAESISEQRLDLERQLLVKQQHLTQLQENGQQTTNNEQLLQAELQKSLLKLEQTSKEQFQLKAELEEKNKLLQQLKEQKLKFEKELAEKGDILKHIAPSKYRQLPLLVQRQIEELGAQLKREKQAVVELEQQMLQIQKTHRQLVEELDKKHKEELEKLSGNKKGSHRDVEDVEEIVADNNAKKQEIDGLMEENTKLAEQLEEYRHKLLKLEQKEKTERELLDGREEQISLEKNLNEKQQKILELQQELEKFLQSQKESSDEKGEMAEESKKIAELLEQEKRSQSEIEERLQKQQQLVKQLQETKAELERKHADEVERLSKEKLQATQASQFISQELFFQIALSIKLQLFQQEGYSTTISITDLYEDAELEGVSLQQAPSWIAKKLYAENQKVQEEKEALTNQSKRASFMGGKVDSNQKSPAKKGTW